MKCSTCDRDVIVTLWHAVTIGKRVVMWHLCVACWRKEQK